MNELSQVVNGHIYFSLNIPCYSRCDYLRSKNLFFSTDLEFAMDVEGRASKGKPLTLNLEQGQEKGTQNDDYGLASAHTIDRGNTLILHLYIFYTVLNSV